MMTTMMMMLTAIMTMPATMKMVKRQAGGSCRTAAEAGRQQGQVDSRSRPAAGAGRQHREATEWLHKARMQAMALSNDVASRQ
jgi:hypothetical protein